MRVETVKKELCILQNGGFLSFERFSWQTWSLTSAVRGL